MIDVYYSKKGTPYVYASDLHKELDISTRLSTWFPRMVEYGFVENQDFSQLHKNVHLEQGGSTIRYEWAVNIEMAKHIAMIQRSERGKALRNYFISLDKKVQEGQLLTHQQVSALFDLCKVFGFFSVQDYLENEHYSVFNRDENWWKYRARILGHSKTELIEIMKGLGKKYRNQRQALMQFDRYELIRRAAFDLFKAMGRSDEYAKNVSTFAKEVAKQIDPEIYDDRETTIDFKTSKQKQTIQQIRDREQPGGFIHKF